MAKANRRLGLLCGTQYRFGLGLARLHLAHGFGRALFNNGRGMADLIGEATDMLGLRLRVGDYGLSVFGVLRQLGNACNQLT